jgi:2,5-dihydroxypyridine 5,6-dioxygenase
MAYGRSFTSHSFAVELVDLFRHQLAMCRLAPGELCLCITDTAWNPAYAAACMGAAHALGAEAYEVVFPASRPLPSRTLADAWRQADLIVYMTTFKLHYRPEIRAALDAGTRVLCVMQPVHVMERLKADPEVRRRTRAGAALLDAARVIRITSPAGTDLVMDKTGRAGLAHYGAADEPGHLDFWGGGMVQAAQLEGTTEGRLVLDVGDCCFHLGRMIERPTVITFREGRAVSFEGGLDAELIKAEIEAGGSDSAFMAGHMAWGTDHRARWLQAIHQTPDAGGGGADNEGFLGSIQVEIGSNDDVIFGGRNSAATHLGLCLRNASLSLDGRPIIENGSFAIDELKPVTG